MTSEEIEESKNILPVHIAWAIRNCRPLGAEYPIEEFDIMDMAKATIQIKNYTLRLILKA